MQTSSIHFINTINMPFYDTFELLCRDTPTDFFGNLRCHSSNTSGQSALYKQKQFNWTFLFSTIQLKFITKWLFHFYACLTEQTNKRLHWLRFDISTSHLYLNLSFMYYMLYVARTNSSNGNQLQMWKLWDKWVTPSTDRLEISKKLKTLTYIPGINYLFLHVNWYVLHYY